jgi:hypothetical protein
VLNYNRRRYQLGPWSIVGLGLLAACLLSLLGPFGQSQCTYVPATNWAEQLPGPAPLSGYAVGAKLCTNTVWRGAFYGAP